MFRHLNPVCDKPLPYRRRNNMVVANGKGDREWDALVGEENMQQLLPSICEEMEQGPRKGMSLFFMPTFK